MVGDEWDIEQQWKPFTSQQKENIEEKMQQIFRYNKL